jgi:hypothetical protein
MFSVILITITFRPIASLNVKYSERHIGTCFHHFKEYKSQEHQYLVGVMSACAYKASLLRLFASDIMSKQFYIRLQHGKYREIMVSIMHIKGFFQSQASPVALRLQTQRPSRR